MFSSSVLWLSHWWLSFLFMPYSEQQKLPLCQLTDLNFKGRGSTFNFSRGPFIVNVTCLGKPPKARSEWAFCWDFASLPGAPGAVSNAPSSPPGQSSSQSTRAFPNCPSSWLLLSPSQGLSLRMRWYSSGSIWALSPMEQTLWTKSKATSSIPTCRYVDELLNAIFSQCTHTGKLYWAYFMLLWLFLVLIVTLLSILISQTRNYN